MRARWFVVVLAVLVALGLCLPSGRALGAADPYVSPVSANPADFTPDVLDGRVNQLVQIGNKVIAAGTFTQVRAKGANQPTLNRSNIFAFDPVTGAIDTSFAPVVNGEVRALLPAADGLSVYAAGAFTSANSATANRLVRLRTADGGTVASFRPGSINSIVNDLRLVRGQLLLIGQFSAVAGAARSYAASVDANTGALTDFFRPVLSGPRAGTPSALKMDVTPDGSRLAVLGNFSVVDGQSRPQLAVFDVAGPTAVLANWRTGFYRLDACSTAFWTYMRDLDIDPSGNFMVVTTTGAYGGPDSPCDVISRWELNTTGEDLQPTWSDYTGGDTTYAVHVTPTIAYIGGHFRWMNNPYAGDAVGPGAIPRNGLAALDVRNGMPLRWNPTRDRGVGVFDFLPTAGGLYFGSDTSTVAGETHRRLAMFPVTSTPLPAERVGALPGQVVLLGDLAPTDPSVLYRVNAGGPTLGSVDDGPEWEAGDQSPYVNTGNSAGWGPVANVDASVPNSDSDRAPRALFDSERWDDGSEPEMRWSFPVTAGRDVEVRLFLANRYDGTGGVGQRVFDVSIDGDLKLDDLDMVEKYGDQTGHMESFRIVSDGSVDIDFGHVVENPLVNGIEIIDLDAPPPAPAPPTDTIQKLSFDGTNPPISGPTAEGPESWGSVRGSFLVDDVLYTGWSNGTLTRRSFNGSSFGPVSVVNLYDGYFGNELGGVTGMFYEPSTARLYFTMAGSNSLYWRAFLPESETVGAIRYEAAGDVGAMSPALVRGMFRSGDALYFADKNSGSLSRVGFSGGVVSGPRVLVDASIDWRSRGMFVTQGAAPNTPPKAVIESTCTALVCDFSGAKSTDAEGPIASYAWQFQSAGTAAGATAKATFPSAGSYLVTLTVTDAGGLTSTSSATVTVQSPPSSAIAFRASAGFTGNTATPSVRVPASVAQGDALLLSVTTANGVVPPTPAGWTLVDQEVDAQLRGHLFTRVAAATTAGSVVSVPLGTISKTDMTLLAYTGTSPDPVASVNGAVELGNTAAHAAPAATVSADGSWVVSIWLDRSSATTSWAAPAGATVRSTLIGTGSGRLTSLAVDYGPQAAGPFASRTATANSVSPTAAMWTVVLKPSGS